VRAFAPEDAAAMTEVYCDPEVMRFIPGGALADEAAVRALLAKGRDWAIVERASGAVVGDVGLATFAPTGDLEVGYTLARRFWGRGYATEAARAVVAAALEQVPRVIAAVDAENDASMRVALRLGMRRVDELPAYGRPHVIFST
jgi:ribosomal-protein-alanine N-acetyltransferase